MLSLRSRDVNAHRAPTQPALPSTGAEGQYLEQHLHTQTAAHKCGAAHRAPSSMHTPPQKTGLQLRRCPGLWWSELDQPSWLTSSLLRWGWSLFSPFSCTWILLLPFSCLLAVTPAFSLHCSRFCKIHTQISQGYLCSLGLTELLIQFPRQCWSCHIVLTQETLILPLQSSVMFGHCSWSPTISTCEFQQSSGHAL